MLKKLLFYFFKLPIKNFNKYYISIKYLSNERFTLKNHPVYE